MVLRESDSVADFCGEQKLRYEYAKLKYIVLLRNRSRYASATLVATGYDMR